jgi:hypothetical protein
MCVTVPSEILARREVTLLMVRPVPMDIRREAELPIVLGVPLPVRAAEDVSEMFEYCEFWDCEEGIELAVGSERAVM